MGICMLFFHLSMYVLPRCHKCFRADSSTVSYNIMLIGIRTSSKA